MDMEMASKRRVMTYDNLTEVPAPSSLVRLIFLFFAPVDISCARKMLVGSAFYWCRVTGASLRDYH